MRPARPNCRAGREFNAYGTNSIPHFGKRVDIHNYIGMVAGIVAGGLLIELSLSIFIEPIESLLLLLQPATANSSATPRDEIRI